VVSRKNRTTCSESALQRQWTAQARRSLRISAYAGLIVAVVAWLPFALWVLGTIPGYSAALILAIIAVVATMTWAMGRLPKPSRPSPQAA